MIAWTARGTKILHLAVVLVLLVLAWRFGGFLAQKDMQTAMAAIILSTLILVSLILFWLVARSDPEGALLFAVMSTSFVIKLGAMAVTFYGHLLVDALTYDSRGAHLAHGLAIGLGPVGTRPYGTDFMTLLVGLVYAVTGQTVYGISILWAWLGLLGMLFFYKAFCTAFPAGNRRFYMFVLFFFPSMVLWTSELGKDALMVLFLGMAAYGTARFQRRVEPLALLWLAFGGLGMALIRPHIAAVFVAALGASVLIQPIRVGLLRPVIRLGMLIALIIMAVIVVRVAANYADLEGVSAEDVSSYLETKQQTTMRGASTIESSNPTSIAGFVQAIPTVLFVPFPWQVSGTSTLVAGVESLCLMGLFLVRWRSVTSALARTFRESYLLMIFVAVVLFIFIFSVISNLGVLDRQRAQMWPFVFMWLAYRTDSRRGGSELHRNAQRIVG